MRVLKNVLNDVKKVCYPVGLELNVCSNIDEAVKPSMHLNTWANQLSEELTSERRLRQQLLHETSAL
jgi:hypothetical protein